MNEDLNEVPNMQGSSEKLLQRTAALSVIVNGVASLRQLIIPLLIGLYSFREDIASVSLAGTLIALAFLVIFVVTSLQWLRYTYCLAEQDIRVESGLLSRTARSVPYRRIQDVSFEQKLLPRLLGLVEVKIETGAGGSDDLKLTYLTLVESNSFRKMIRERRDHHTSSGPNTETYHHSADAAPSGVAIFKMDTKRLAIFGTFEFSLAVFAVIGGLLQYAETFLGFDIWDRDLLATIATNQRVSIEQLGPFVQFLTALAVFFILVLVGFATGLIRTFLRDWGFVLEKTSHGFRRRRGLITKTDVVMPLHRVQALILSSGLVKRRFGWHSLKFVSLAQDAGSSHHVVAPFARIEELEPIIIASNFSLPKDDLEWHQASQKYRRDRAGQIFLFGGLVTLTMAPWFSLPLLILPILLGILYASFSYFTWKFQRHAISETQLFACRGLLFPITRISSRAKLHSVEIQQGPIAAKRGYASLRLGLAGGDFSISGIPIERARTLKSSILSSITKSDFSALT